MLIFGQYHVYIRYFKLFLSHLHETFFPFCMHKMQIFFSSISANCLEKKTIKAKHKNKPKKIAILLQLFLQNLQTKEQKMHTAIFVCEKQLGLKL